MKRDGDIYTLASGREFYANRGIVGIRPSEPGKYLEISEGYDGELYDRDEDAPWTPEERRELANYMIGLWNAFAAGGRVCAQCGGYGSTYIVHQLTCLAEPLPGEERGCTSCRALTGQRHRDTCARLP